MASRRVVCHDSCFTCGEGDVTIGKPGVVGVAVEDTDLAVGAMEGFEALEESLEIEIHVRKSSPGVPAPMEDHKRPACLAIMDDARHDVHRHVGIVVDLHRAPRTVLKIRCGPDQTARLFEV